MQVKREAAVLGLVALAASMVAQAQVYRCDGPGGPVFSQVPCATDAATIRLDKAPAIDPAARDSLDTAVEHGLELIRQDELDRIANTGSVSPGMSPRQVRLAWGEPDRVNRTVRNTGVSEQWVYRRGRGPAQYVHFEDRKVTSVTGSD